MAEEEHSRLEQGADRLALSKHGSRGAYGDVALARRYTHGVY